MVNKKQTNREMLINDFLQKYRERINTDGESKIDINDPVLREILEKHQDHLLHLISNEIEKNPYIKNQHNNNSIFNHDIDFKYSNRVPEYRELRQLQKENETIQKQLKDQQKKLDEAGKSEKERQTALDSIQEFKDELEQRDQQIHTLQADLARQQEELETGIQDAQSAIEESIAETNTDITTYRKSSGGLIFLGSLFYLATAIAALYIGYELGFIAPPTDDKWISRWVAIATPLLLFFSIGTAFLRHDAKIRQRYEHLSDKKHTLEKASGVLRASSHLSQVENLEENHPLIAETFSKVSTSLLEVKANNKKGGDEKGSGEERVVIDTLLKELAKKSVS